MAADPKAQALAQRKLEAAGKYLTFFLASEEYGIPILKVQQIIGVTSITVVPRTPHYVLGVINLRGKIIPVIDIRRKLDMDPVEPSEANCIIVVKSNNIEMGMYVDRVSEVLSVTPEDIEDTPFFGGQVSTEYLVGIAKTQGRVRLLLDIDKALSTSELMQLSAAFGGGLVSD